MIAMSLRTKTIATMHYAKLFYRLVECEEILRKNEQRRATHVYKGE